MSHELIQAGLLAHNILAVENTFYSHLKDPKQEVSSVHSLTSSKDVDTLGCP